MPVVLATCVFGVRLYLAVSPCRIADTLPSTLLPAASPATCPYTTTITVRAGYARNPDPAFFTRFKRFRCEDGR